VQPTEPTSEIKNCMFNKELVRTTVGALASVAHIDRALERCSNTIRSKSAI
jgi:hypothetical protein